MDLSNPFRCIMQRLFPNASIIADRFHYVKLFGECLKRSRLDTCSSLKDEKIAKSIKKNLHLFDKYRKDLDDQTEWYDRHLKNTLPAEHMLNIYLNRMVQMNSTIAI